MKIFIIGASGYLGGAAARALAHAGHDVVASARSDAARERLSALGYAVVAGDAAEPATLLAAAGQSDAVLWAVQMQQADAVAVEERALRALTEALAGTSKALLYTSGVWCYGSTGDRIADEATPTNPLPFQTARPRIERIVLEGAAAGIRALVVRPGCVYGEGKGLPALYMQSARESGAARTFGDGANRWAVVNVDDLAQFYRLVLEKAAAGEIYNAADDSSFTQREIAAAASRGAGRGGAVEAWPLEEARKAMGDWVEALTLDQRVSSQRARSRLGWNPGAPSIVDDLERGSYVRST